MEFTSSHNKANESDAHSAALHVRGLLAALAGMSRAARETASYLQRGIAIRKRNEYYE